MTHDVEVDEAAIIDEMGRAVDGQYLPKAEAQPEIDQGSAWQIPAEIIAGIIANKVTPNWEIPPETQKQWAEAFAGCLDQLLPGGIGNVESWGPWGKLAFATGAVMLCGVDLQKMEIKPLKEEVEGPEVGDDSGEAPINPAPGGRYAIGG